VGGLSGPDKPGTIDAKALGNELFPFDAWEFEDPSKAAPVLRLKAPWKLALGAASELYSPVASEPSLGTPHRHYAALVSAVPANNNVQVTSLSAQLPAGARWIEGRFSILASAADPELMVYDEAGTDVYDIVKCYVANKYGRGHFSCPVDSSLNLRWSTSDRAITTALDIIMTRYWE
jgi:hypothetical protein